MNTIFEVGEPGGPPADADAGDVERRIARASAAFSDAYVRGDLEALAALYPEDAVLLPPETEVRGRQRIADYFRAGPGRVNVAHAMRSDELRVDGDRAVDVGTWSNTWRGPDGQARAAEGRYMVVWGRGADGAWRIEYDMWHRPTG